MHHNRQGGNGNRARHLQTFQKFESPLVDLEAHTFKYNGTKWNVVNAQTPARVAGCMVPSLSW